MRARRKLLAAILAAAVALACVPAQARVILLGHSSPSSIAYPASVVAAGLQAVYDRGRGIGVGPATTPTKYIGDGVHSLPPECDLHQNAGWFVRCTASTTLDGWDFTDTRDSTGGTATVAAYDAGTGITVTVKNSKFGPSNGCLSGRRDGGNDVPGSTATLVMDHDEIEVECYAPNGSIVVQDSDIHDTQMDALDSYVGTVSIIMQRNRFTRIGMGFVPAGHIEPAHVVGGNAQFLYNYIDISAAVNVTYASDQAWTAIFYFENRVGANISGLVQGNIILGAAALKAAQPTKFTTLTQAANKVAGYSISVTFENNLSELGVGWLGNTAINGASNPVNIDNGNNHDYATGVRITIP